MSEACSDAGVSGGQPRAAPWEGGGGGGFRYVRGDVVTSRSTAWCFVGDDCGLERFCISAVCRQ